MQRWTSLSHPEYFSMTWCIPRRMSGFHDEAATNIAAAPTRRLAFLLDSISGLHIAGQIPHKLRTRERFAIDARIAAYGSPGVPACPFANLAQQETLLAKTSQDAHRACRNGR